MKLKKLINLPILIVIGVIFILAFFGFLIDAKSFSINLIAGFIEIIITLTVINWWLIRQRRKQWKSVRSQIVKALLNHFGNIASEFETNFEIRPRKYDLMAFVGEIGKGYDSPTPETAYALHRMAEIMKKAQKYDGAREQAEKVHEIIKWDIEQIRSVLLPRILSMDTNEPGLVLVLSELDNADREWVNQFIADTEISIGEQFEAAAHFLSKMADAYQYLVDHVD